MILGGQGFGQKRGVASAAAPRGRLHWSALDLHIGLLSASRCCRTHSLLDLSSHSHEGLFHIGGVLSTSFQERDAEGISKFLFKNKEYLTDLSQCRMGQICIKIYRTCMKIEEALETTTKKKNMGEITGKGTLPLPLCSPPLFLLLSHTCFPPITC